MSENISAFSRREKCFSLDIPFYRTHYQIACILAVLKQPDAAFEWLEKSVDGGFACWPFFLKDPCLQNLHGRPDFEVLVSALQAKYPDHLGLL